MHMNKTTVGMRYVCCVNKIDLRATISLFGDTINEVHAGLARVQTTPYKA